MNGYTSDHTIRIISVRNNNEASIKGATWNLMNQCHGLQFNSTLNKTYSNNPFHVDETLQEYKERKITQVDYMLKKIQSGQLDFMFLQEVDFIQEDRNDNKRKQIREEINTYFKHQLKQAGYEVVITQHGRGAQPKYYSQQPMITIYNPNRLQYTGKQYGVLGLESSTPAKDGTKRYRFRGHASHFIDKKSQRPIALTNVHLDFSENYNQSLENYMTHHTKKNIITIMGGDTNHSQNNKIHHLITDWHHASNIDSNDGNNLSVYHQENPKVKKAYDGFMVAPAGNSTIKATELESEYFELNVSQKSVQVKTFHQDIQHRTHVSLPGRPWQRYRHLAAQIDKEYGQEKIQTKRNILQKELAYILNQLDETIESFHQKYGTLINSSSQTYNKPEVREQKASHAHPTSFSQAQKNLEEKVGTFEDTEIQKSIRNIRERCNKLYSQQPQNKILLTKVLEKTLEFINNPNSVQVTNDYLSFTQKMLKKPSSMQALGKMMFGLAVLLCGLSIVLATVGVGLLPSAGVSAASVGFFAGGIMANKSELNRNIELIDEMVCLSSLLASSPKPI